MRKFTILKNVQANLFILRDSKRRFTAETKVKAPRDMTQLLATTGLGVSVLVIVGGFLLPFDTSLTTASTKSEPIRNSLIIKGKEKQINIKRFSSFSTVRHIDQKLSLHLVASVVAETIPKSALVQRYQFVESLDDGAFGRVFKAKDRLTEREVAVKVVPHRNMSADQVFNEIDVLRRVRGHENIVHLLQVLNCDKKYFLISELCKGGELLDILAEHSIFCEEEASLFAQKLASALRHIHKCGFAHCDIKPENIVFESKDMKGMQCKIIDFGIARELKKKKFELKAENVESCVGTLAYAPPEILHIAEGRAKEEYPHTLSGYDLRKIDTWALGIVLYICLYGCHPFDIKGEGKENELVLKVLNNDYSFDIHGPEFKVSSAAKDLISGLLNPDPNKRLTPKQVLEHPWLRQVKKIEYLSTLPNSWVSGGFFGGRRRGELEAVEEERFNEFVKENSVDGFIRALLITALLNSNNIDQETHKSSSLFLTQAFNVLDKNAKGLVSLKDIEEILHQTSNNSTKDSDEEVSSELINRTDFGILLRSFGVVSKSLYKGEKLFAQGAEPQGFYILTKGKCALEFDKRVFHISYPGAMFGESALEQGLAKRAVTIRALEACDVTYIPKRLFFRGLAGSPALQTKLFEAARLQQARRIRSLIKRLLAERGETFDKRCYKRGEYLYRIGDEAKNLYFIEKGVVTAVGSEVDKNDFAEGPLRMGVAQRGKGDLTGSSIFFRDSKRYCSVQCMTDVEALVLSKEQIEALLDSNRTLQFYLAAQAKWRMEQWNLRAAEVERGLTEPQLLPILLEQDRKEEEKKDKQESPLAGYAKAVQLMDTHVYQAGETIFKIGDEGDKFFIINSGSAIAELESSNGSKMIVAQFEPGDHFGEAVLLSNRKHYGATVRCEVPCEVLSMSKEKFFELVGDNNTAFAKAIKKANRFRKHRWTKNLLVLARNELEDELSDSLTDAESEDAQEVETISDGDLKIERVELQEGEQLFTEGDDPDAVYYIHKGELSFITDGEGNKTKKEGTVFQPGDALGLYNLVSHTRQKKTCVCKTGPCVLSKIPKETLNHLIENNEYVSENLKKHFDRVAPLRDLERNLDLDLNRKSGDDIDTQSKRRRIVRFFSSFYGRQKENDEEEEPKKRNRVAGKLSFSQLMKELSKET